MKGELFRGVRTAIPVSLGIVAYALVFGVLVAGKGIGIGTLAEHALGGFGGGGPRGQQDPAGGLVRPPGGPCGGGRGGRRERGTRVNLPVMEGVAVIALSALFLGVGTVAALRGAGF